MFDEPVRDHTIPITAGAMPMPAPRLRARKRNTRRPRQGRSSRAQPERAATLAEWRELLSPRIETLQGEQPFTDERRSDERHGNEGKKIQANLRGRLPSGAALPARPVARLRWMDVTAKAPSFLPPGWPSA